MTKKKLKYQKEIAELTLMDDTFFNVCFQDSPECIETILKAILGKKLKVVEHSVQKSIKKISGQSIVLDVKAVDSKNRHFDIEIQRSNSGANPLRARYNAALMDASYKEPGLHGKNLPETYVIFITENDYWKQDAPMYRFDRKCSVPGKPELSFGDNLHIIYVNGMYAGNDPIGNLMSDFRCKDAANVKNKILRERMQLYKTDEKGVQEMCKVMDKLIREENKATAKAKAIEIATKMLKDGIPESKVAEYSGLSLAEVKKIRKSA